MKDQEYLAQVRNASARAKNGASEIIYNRSVEHASALISELILSANEEICILTGCLNEMVYDSDVVLEAVKSVVDTKKVKFRILMDDRAAGSVSPSKKMLKIIRDYQQKTHKDKKPVKKVKNENFKFHFLVVDGRAFRYEPDWEKTEAFANFKDEKNSGKLRDWFDLQWEQTN